MQRTRYPNFGIIQQDDDPAGQFGTALGGLFGRMVQMPQLRAESETQGEMAGLKGILAHEQASGARAKADLLRERLDSTRRLRGSIGGLLDPEDAGIAPSVYDLVTSMETNPHQFGQYLTSRRENRLIRGALEQADKGDIRAFNTTMAAVDRKPINFTDIKGGVAFNPHDAPEQDVRVTPAGEAEIGVKGSQQNVNTARLGEIVAQADLHRARAARERRLAETDPKTAPLAGSLGHYFQRPVLDAKGRPMLDPLTQRPVLAPDPAEIEGFLAWFAASGERDMNAALARYALAKQSLSRKMNPLGLRGAPEAQRQPGAKGAGDDPLGLLETE